MLMNYRHMGQHLIVKNVYSQFLFLLWSNERAADTMYRCSIGEAGGNYYVKLVTLIYQNLQIFVQQSADALFYDKITTGKPIQIMTYNFHNYLYKCQTIKEKLLKQKQKQWRSKQVKLPLFLWIIWNAAAGISNVCVKSVNLSSQGLCYKRFTFCTHGFSIPAEPKTAQ